MIMSDDKTTDLAQRVRDRAWRDNRVGGAARELIDAAIALADANGRFTPPWEEWARVWEISVNSAYVRVRRLAEIGYLQRLGPALYQLAVPKDHAEDKPGDLAARVEHLEESAHETTVRVQRIDTRSERIAERTARIETQLGEIMRLIGEERRGSE